MVLPISIMFMTDQVPSISDTSYQPSPQIMRQPTAAALAETVATIVADAVNAGITQRGHANLVFSGGSTPELFLPFVAALNLPWQQVNITLADERWVDEDSPYSNTAMLRRTLLQHTTPPANFIPLKNAAATAAAGAAAIRAGLPPIDQHYDLVLLGMGNDGHFASLFPGTPRLAELLSPTNTERIAAIPAPRTAAPAVERISMTLAELKRSERLVLVLQGETKLNVFKRAYSMADELQAPIVALGDVEVIWCP